MMHGALGDVILVNGVAQPRFEVANRKYRLRILNGSNARAYELALSSGHRSCRSPPTAGCCPAPSAGPPSRCSRSSE
jgi:hypothetical protein